MAFPRWTVGTREITKKQSLREADLNFMNDELSNVRFEYADENGNGVILRNPKLSTVRKLIFASRESCFRSFYSPGGAIYIEDKSGLVVYSLGVGYNKEHEYSLIYDLTWIDTYYSLGNKELMDNIAEYSFESYIPIGLFVSAEVAWLAVEDFIERKGVKSSRIDWISAQNVPDYSKKVLAIWSGNKVSDDTDRGGEGLVGVDSFLRSFGGAP